MASNITVSLTFCYKGQAISPSLTINLDEKMKNEGQLPCFHSLLAQKLGYDAYSHEYDVLMMAELEYKDVEGWVSKFIENGQFDREAFAAQWFQRKLDKAMQDIASRHMNIDILEAHTMLKEALHEAYQLGISTALSSNKVDRDTTFVGF